MSKRSSYSRTIGISWWWSRGAWMVSPMSSCSDIMFSDACWQGTLQTLYNGNESGIEIPIGSLPYIKSKMLPISNKCGLKYLGNLFDLGTDGQCYLSIVGQSDTLRWPLRWVAAALAPTCWPGKAVIPTYRMFLPRLRLIRVPSIAN